MQSAAITNAVQPANAVFGGGSISNSYVIWRDPDNLDSISKVGKVKRYGIQPRCDHPLLELYWVAGRDSVVEPWRLICETAPQVPVALTSSRSGCSGHGVHWSKPPALFGPEHGLLRVPRFTNVLVMQGQHHLVVSRPHDGDPTCWDGDDRPQHQLQEYHLTLESEPLLILQPLPQVHLYRNEHWSLAIVSDVVEHCPLNAWYEGVPYHAHRLTL